MSSPLELLTTVTPFVPALVAFVGGLYALWAMRREPIRSRTDLRSGIGLTVLVALGLGAFAGLTIYSLSGFDSGPRPEALGPAAAYGAIVAGLTGLSGLAGYVLLARRASGIALLGSVLGPVLLIGVSIGAMFVSANLSNAAYRSQQESDAATIADRSRGLTLTVSDVTASLASDGVAIGVAHLHATIHTDRDIAFQSGLKIDNPRFQVVVMGVPPLDLAVGADSPVSLSRDRDSTWDLAYTVPAQLLGPYAGTERAPGPGEWKLRISFVDTEGAEYLLENSITVAPAP
ncbi:MAG: hypothetical protein ABI573_03520 [Chloroflexota bacterium]